MDSAASSLDGEGGIDSIEDMDLVGFAPSNTSADAVLSENDDIIMGGVRELSHTGSDYGMPDEHDSSNLYYQSPLSVKSRQLPIQIVLRPPPNPSEYERIKPSQVVERILDEEAFDDRVFYRVEFKDGYIDQIAHEDFLELANSDRAAHEYQLQRTEVDETVMSGYSDKHPRREDGQSSSDGSVSRRLTKRPKIPEPSPAPMRRSSRQASKQTSRQTSTDNALELNDFDEEFGDEDYDEEAVKKRSAKRSARHSGLLSLAGGRTTRSTNQARQSQLTQYESEDELAREPEPEPDENDENSDYIPVVRSDINGAARASLRKKRKQKTRNARYVLSDSDIEFEPTRKSSRSNKTSKSMKDPDMDDDYEVFDEDKALSAIKYVGIKETFEEQPRESEFRKSHSNKCESCGSTAGLGKGSLIFCQGCSYSYHKQCIGARSQRDHRVTKVGPTDFVLQCRFCIGLQKSKDPRSPSYANCQICKIRGVSCAEFSTKKTPKQEETARSENGGEDPITSVAPHLINQHNNVLFRCSTCRCAYHFEHLPPLTTSPDKEPSVRDERVNEYASVGWKCKTCLDAKHKIHALVAWRPTDQDAYQKSQRAEEFSADEIEYLVKWDGRSHCHDTWMSGAWVYGIAAPATRTAFHKRDGNEYPRMTTKSAVEKEWMLIDVVLDVKYRRGSSASSKAQDRARISHVVSAYVKFQGLSYEEAVWDEPPHPDSEALWDAFQAAYDEYVIGKYFPSAEHQRMKESVSLYRTLDFQEECELKEQPSSLRKGHKIMQYQLEGVNFLLYNFHQQLNVILADEMGLGKTIQVVTFISTLVLDQPKCWPFLVVVPNATCPNWRRELKDWSPSLRVVTYHGGRASQELAYNYELFPEGVKAGMKAHVVIMSYEAASTAKATFHGIKWAGLIVDEGQRLKNDETQLYKTLLEMKIPYRALLTGTPLQNNKKELFNLLQFVDPKNNAEVLNEQYNELTKENLPELHALIRPYFLRRTKADVLKFLPPMAQIIVPVTMTVLQEKLSKSIIQRNPQLIEAILSKGKMKAGDRKNLSNIIADLRQCLCHPFCFSGEVEDKTVGEEQMRRNLIEASPKLILLEMMLPKLKEKGHRVLIFSQFLRCLDILEDFLNSLGLQHGRIDGGLSALQKQKQIDAFNAPDSPLFAMLLSTRAGGVGINLATADTVIIYDPDWNPHQDLQAISRAHRIGQKEKVLCFQLTTIESIEENILQAGKKKLALDHALIESIDREDDSGNDLESILKRGAESLFSDKDRAKITYDAASVDKLLDRSRIESSNGDDDMNADKKFSFARVWANNSGTLVDNVNSTTENNATTADASVWENILKAREEQHKREVAARQEVYGRGARRRGTQAINYNSSRRPEPDSGGSDVDDDDELYIDLGVEVDDDDDDDDGDDGAFGLEERGAPTATNSMDAKAIQVETEHTHNIRMAKKLATDAAKPPRKAHQNTAENSTKPAKPNVIMPQPRPLPSQQMPPVQRSPMPIQNIPHNPAYQNIPSHLLHPSMRPNPQPPYSPHPNSVPSVPSSSSSLLPEPLVRHLNSLPPAVPATSQSMNWQAGRQVFDERRPANPTNNSLPIRHNFDCYPCPVCKAEHSVNHPCLNLNSQVSLRVAIDNLRNSPGLQAYRSSLIKRLQQLEAPKG